MSYELLLLLPGAAIIAIVFRAKDPFRISAMKRAMRSGDTQSLVALFDTKPQGRVKAPSGRPEKA